MRQKLKILDYFFLLYFRDGEPFLYLSDLRPVKFTQEIMTC